MYVKFNTVNICTYVTLYDLTGLVCRCYKRLGIWFDSFLPTTQKSGRKDAHLMQVKVKLEN